MQYGYMYVFVFTYIYIYTYSIIYIYINIIIILKYIESGMFSNMSIFVILFKGHHPYSIYSRNTIIYIYMYIHMPSGNLTYGEWTIYR